MGVLQKIYERHAVKKKTELRDIGRDLSIAWEKALKANLGGEDWIATQIDAVVEAMEAMDGKKADAELKKFQKRLDEQIAGLSDSKEPVEEPNEAPDMEKLEDAMDSILVGKEKEEEEEEDEADDEAEEGEKAKGEKEKGEEEGEEKEGEEKSDGKKSPEEKETKDESGEKESDEGSGEKEPEEETGKKESEDESGEKESEEESGKTGEQEPGKGEEEESEGDEQEQEEKAIKAALAELKSRVEEQKKFLEKEYFAPMKEATATYEAFAKQLKGMYDRMKEVRKVYEKTKAVAARDEAAFYIPQYVELWKNFRPWVPSISSSGERFQKIIDLMMYQPEIYLLDLASKLPSNMQKHLKKAEKEDRHDWKKVASNYKKIRKMANSVHKDLYACGCNIRGSGHIGAVP